MSEETSVILLKFLFFMRILNSKVLLFSCDSKDSGIYLRHRFLKVLD